MKGRRTAPRPASASGTRVSVVTFDEMEAVLWARLEALPPAARAELIHVLPLVLLGAYAGLRFGEASALRTPHLHPLERRVEISEGCAEVNGKLYVGPLKTKESRRVVTIPAFLADELGVHLAGVRSDADLIFPSPTGGPIRRTNFGHRFWTPAVMAAGISPAPTFHALRHFAAALAIAQGAHPKAIQARMGHASITTTLNTYGHLFPSLDVELAERLEEVRADALAARLRRVGPEGVVPIERARR